MKQLGQSAIGTGSGTTVYTVPTGMKTDVLDILVANTTGSPINLSLHIVASGGSASTSNAIFYQASVPGHSTIHWCGVQHMTVGKFIQGIGSASGLTATISGDEMRSGA